MCFLFGGVLFVVDTERACVPPFHLRLGVVIFQCVPVMRLALGHFHPVPPDFPPIKLVPGLSVSPTSPLVVFATRTYV